MTVEVTKKTRGPEPQSMTRAELCLRVEGMTKEERTKLDILLSEDDDVSATLDRREQGAREAFRQMMDAIREQRTFAEKWNSLSDEGEASKVLAALRA